MGERLRALTYGDTTSDLFITSYSNKPNYFYISKGIREIIKLRKIIAISPEVIGNPNYDDINDRDWQLQIELKENDSDWETISFEPYLVSDKLDEVIKFHMVDFTGIADTFKERAKVKIYFAYEEDKLIAYLSNNNLF